MIIPSGFAQANFIFTGDNAPFGAQVTLGLDVSGGSGFPVNVAEDVGQAWVDNILPGQSDQITLDRVLVKFGPNDLGPFAEFPQGAPGGDGSDVEQPSVAMLVKKQTSIGGRAGRGRLFVPGIEENHFGPEGTMNGADVISYNAAWEAFRQDLITLNLPPVVLHAEGSPLSTPTPITSFSVDSRAATQRRRLRG